MGNILAAALLAVAVTLTATHGAPEPRRVCHARGALPDPVCTPGDVETTDLKIICGQSTTARRAVPESLHKLVLADYGITSTPPAGSIEVDHLVSLELGGSNSRDNLWPEPAAPLPGYHQKDVVENWSHREVCAGRMTLAFAQAKIAADWTGLQRTMEGRPDP